jgi:hypothetical protein
MECSCDYHSSFCIHCIVNFTKDMKCDKQYAKKININDVLNLINNDKIDNFNELKKYNKLIIRQLKINKLININD